VNKYDGRIATTVSCDNRMQRSNRWCWWYYLWR